MTLTRPLAVALVAPDCNKRDGQARYVAETAEGLAERGHEVHVFSVGFAETDPERVTHHPIAAPARAVRTRFAAMLVNASRAVRRYQRRHHRFDVVHALGASCTSPSVVTFQFCQAAWGEVLARDVPVQLAGGPVDAVARSLIAAAERAVAGARSVRRVIAVSPQTAAEVAHHYGHADATVIPNGVDLDRFHPRRREQRASVRDALGIPRDAFCAAFLGEYERKNLATVLRALSHPAARDVTLVAAGRSDPTPFQRQARDLGVERRVVLAPPTDTPETFLGAADAFVFPTLYEPFGMVALEAAACAVPVIVSRRAGFADWVDDGRNGLVLGNPLDAERLATLLAELADGDRAARLGTAGRELAAGFGWSELVGQTESVYRAATARD